MNVAVAAPGRRAADHLPRRAATRAGRFLLAPQTQSDHMRGWIAYGMSRPLPPAASAEMRAGYAEHRNHVISLLTAMP